MQRTPWSRNERRSPNRSKRGYQTNGCALPILARAGEVSESRPLAVLEVLVHVTTPPIAGLAAHRAGGAVEWQSRLC